MDIYTIGFAKKSAEQFFGLLRASRVRRVLDIRLRNETQLAGFTKKDDLSYFLSLHRIAYEHERLLAPTDELLDAYRGKRANWDEYQARFRALIEGRQVEKVLKKAGFRRATALLCSEPTPEKCHRRVAVEYLAEQWPGVVVKHL